MIYKNTFTINKTSKNFELVTRALCKDQHNDILEIDLHDYFFKFYKNDDLDKKFELILKELVTDEDINNADYIMNCLIFKINHNEVLISYSGLLMSLKYNKNIYNFKEDKNIVALIRPI